MKYLPAKKMKKKSWSFYEEIVLFIKYIFINFEVLQHTCALKKVRFFTKRNQQKDNNNDCRKCIIQYLVRKDFPHIGFQRGLNQSIGVHLNSEK